MSYRFYFNQEQTGVTEEDIKLKIIQKGKKSLTKEFERTIDLLNDNTEHELDEKRMLFNTLRMASRGMNKSIMGRLKH
jgi:hypothetical protein